jgi:hypothetical protein
MKKTSLMLYIYHILNRIAHMLLLYIIIAHFTNKNTILTIYIIKVFIFLLFTLLRFFFGIFTRNYKIRFTKLTAKEMLANRKKIFFEM